MKNSLSYQTRQRNLVLDCIRDSQGRHLTAEDIAEKLQRDGTPVGKSTIYRFLNILAEEGTLKKYYLEEGVSACYQYLKSHETCHEHYHLKCSRCGTLLHAQCQLLDDIEQTILALYHFRIDSSKTILYGQCANCAAQRSENQ